MRTQDGQQWELLVKTRWQFVINSIKGVYYLKDNVSTTSHIPLSHLLKVISDNSLIEVSFYAHSSL